MSIIRIGLSEGKNYADGWEAAFGGKKKSEGDSAKKSTESEAKKKSKDAKKKK